MMKQREFYPQLNSVTCIYISTIIILLQVPNQQAFNHSDIHNYHNISISSIEPSESLLPAGKCSSCEAREEKSIVASGKSNCYCDQKCQLYDDCCHDSTWTESIVRRIELGSDKLNERRSQWQCRGINSIVGDIILRASCKPEWFKQQDDLSLANLVSRRCKYIRDRGKPTNSTSSNESVPDDDDQAAGLDPIGMMMPITDLTSGETFANSYCLRCNTLISEGEWAEILKRRKLIYWSPLLECNYNVNIDERNYLYDLISSLKGQALQYSREINRWIIVAGKKPITDIKTDSIDKDNELRVCSITPSMPFSVEHLIRYCEADLIRSCPSPNSTQPLEDRGELYRQARLECESGHQSITYSLTSKAVYYNPACAVCNQEREYSCERKPIQVGPILLSSVDKNVTLLFDGSGVSIANIDDELTSSAGRANTNTNNEIAIWGSFSILMDLYGSPQDEASADNLVNLTYVTTNNGNNTDQQQQQQQQHQIQQQQSQQCVPRQVYDPFYLTCRCMICGLNQKYLRGKCVVKFKPAMVRITDVCLVISIASLALYLFLYALSTFDLRPLASKLASWEFHAEAQERALRENQLPKQTVARAENQNSKQFNKHGGSGYSYQRSHSGGSDESSSSSGPTSGGRKSKSLPTRSVASLASSLLAAYLLFMLGHQTETGIQAKRQPICAALAAATYYFFLVSFCWMFLLAYDIWRTLRLATCQLKAPVMHSQSVRFLSYTLLALLVSALLVSFAVLIDHLPPAQANCNPNQQLPYIPDPEQQQAGNSSSCTNNWWSHFVQKYQPKFGHQPGSCWFSNRRSLALFFGLPVSLIMVANLIFFLHSSYMVIRGSGKSLNKLSGGSKKSSQLTAVGSIRSPKPFVSLVGKGLSKADGNTNSVASDFIPLPSSLTTMNSVQTLRSHLSASQSLSCSAAWSTSQESLANMSPLSGQILSLPPLDEAKELEEPNLLPPPPPPSGPKHAKLETSLSAFSLATDRPPTPAIKYDSHLQSLHSIMGSIVKDYRLYCRLSTMIGLTWLIGLLASLVDQSDILWYLFVVLNSLQGLFIFLAFGCKRSKLSNLKILFNYLRFWLAYRCSCSDLPKKSRNRGQHQ